MSSLPADRRIAQGRTHSQSWSALRYACAVQVHRPSMPVAAIYKAVGIFVVAVMAVPLALHFLLAMVR